MRDAQSKLNGDIAVSIKSLLLASVGYVVAGVVAGGLLANGAAVSGKPDNLRDQVALIAKTESNKDSKRDRLTVPVTLAAAEPVTTSSVRPLTVSAFAAVPPSRGPLVVNSAPQTRPAVTSAKRQATYSILSNDQIAGLKERMKLTEYQEQQWPAIEAALRKIAARLHRNGKNGVDAPPSSIDPNSPEVDDLKAAAMPLLFTLSEDQKREVRSLARIIGLEAVASAI
jgi:hypothetical protein